MKKCLITSALVFLFVTTSIFAQQDYKKPTLENKDSWSLILIPDIQNYVKWNRNTPILDLMMAWVEDNIDSLNIKMVMCAGDLVETDEKIANDNNGDRTTQQQWETASRVLSRLDGKVAYIAATGNHDYSIDRMGNRSTRYNEFFTIERNHLNKKYLVQHGKNEQGRPSLDNAAYEIKNLNGKDYLFLTLEYGPRDSMLTWAKKIVDLKQYKNHRVVLLTHNYLNTKNTRTTSEIKWRFLEPYIINNATVKAPTIPLPNANNGEQIWQKLVEPVSNIELVLCGHITGEGYRKDKNKAGKTVHQMLFDAQSMGGGHREGNGGDGWLRILEFMPDGKTVKVKTFSPLFAASPSTRHLAWKKDERNEYVFKFD